MKQFLLFLLSAVLLPIAVNAQPQADGTYKDFDYTYSVGVIQCLHGQSLIPTEGAKTTKEAWQAWPTDANLKVFRRGDDPNQAAMNIGFNTVTDFNNNKPKRKGYYNQLLFTITSYNSSTKTGTVELGGTYTIEQPGINFQIVKLFTRPFDGSQMLSDEYKSKETGYEDVSLNYVDRIVIPKEITINSDPDVAGTYQGNSIAGATFTVTGISDFCVYKILGIGYEASESVEIWLPSTVTTIGESAFDPMTLTWAGEYYRVTDYKFYSSLDGSGNPVAGENNVQHIGKNAFTYNEDLKSLPIGSNTITIGEGAFAGCRTLDYGSLSSCTNLESIGKKAFEYLWVHHNLEETVAVSLDLSALTKLTEIPQRCWFQASLSSIKLPNSITTIGEEAFSWCGLEGELSLPTNIETIDKMAFYDNRITSITNLNTLLKSKKLKSIGELAFSQNKISYLKFDPANQYHADLTFGKNAFYRQSCELTVEMDEACTTVPEYLNKGLSEPLFGGQTSNYVAGIDEYGYYTLAPNCLRVIVPINCISTYREDVVMGQIPLHDYRVKFKWGTFTNQASLNSELNNKSLGERSYYELYNITPQQRLIATSSWKNDILCFRPEIIWGGDYWDPGEPQQEAKGFNFDAKMARIGGIKHKSAVAPSSDKTWYANSVDYWDEDAKTATVILTEKDFFDKESFAFNEKNFNKEDEASYPKSLMPYTIHTFHANNGSEEVEQLGRRPVLDGIVPSYKGIVIDFPKPGYYLVPPATVMDYKYGDDEYLLKYEIQKYRLPYAPETRTQVNLNEEGYYFSYPNLRDTKVADTLMVKKDENVMLLFRKSDLEKFEAYAVDWSLEDIQNAFDNAIVYTLDSKGRYTGFAYGLEADGHEWIYNGESYYKWNNNLIAGYFRYVENIDGVNITDYILKNRNSNTEYVVVATDQLYYQNANNPSDRLTTNQLQILAWYMKGVVTNYDENKWTSLTKEGVNYEQYREERAEQLYKLYRLTEEGWEDFTLSEIRDKIKTGDYYEAVYVSWDVILNEYMGGQWETSSGAQYWIDLWNPLEDFAALETHFTTNHDSEMDHNVVIGTPDRFPIFPYWAASPYIWDDAAHDDDHLPLEQRFDNVEDYTTYKAFVHGRMGNGNTFVNLKNVEEGTATFTDTDIHYVNFGISKGYFVQIKTKPGNESTKTSWMQPNRAYFSISRAHMPHIFTGESNEAKLAIFMENTGNETTGIVNVDNTTVTSDNDAWYTLQGVRLNKKPTQNGIYIQNGKKIIIK